MAYDLILSAPHALCDRLNPKRACDLAAALSGQTLCSVAEDQGLTCAYLPGDVLRAQHDLNRRPSRGTPYRQRLRTLLDGADGSGSLVLDVHSFPDYYMEEAGDINFFRRGETPPAIVLIQGPSNIYHGHSLAQTMYDALARAGVPVKILRGITVNDIMQEASDKRIPALLIEFNERFNSEPRPLLQICGIIVATVLKLRAK